MIFYTIRFVKAPSYQKVFTAVIGAYDRRQALIVLKRKEGRKNKIQVLSVLASK
jgi:hypothetical protein